MAQDWSRGQGTPARAPARLVLAIESSVARMWTWEKGCRGGHIERAEELLAMRIGEADETNIGQAELIALAQVHALLAICDLLEARRGELPVQ